MTTFNKIVTLLYLITLLALTIYSYVLVDPNLTLLNLPIWAAFRESAVQIGYYQRALSFNLYFMIVTLLFAFHYYFVFKSKADPFKLALIISIALIISYPFLSHDFFNYLFDAKIVTTYHLNPYLKTALDFPADPWIRFMHWTDRTYPYGPSWLMLSLIPSFLSMGKFILDFFLFKAMFAIFYLAAVYYLNKLNRTWAMFFATSPLIIIEGLVNNHNDLIAASFALNGVCFLLFKDDQIPKLFKFLLGHPRSRWLFNFIHFPLSAGIKYITLPTLILQSSKDSGPRHTWQASKAELDSARVTLRQAQDSLSFWGGSASWRRRLQNLASFQELNTLAFIGVVIAIIYISYKGEIQPWYFLNLFIFIPYFFQWLQNLQIFFMGLLLSYYPYIFLGGWDKPEKVILKHKIMIVGFIANLVYLAFKKRGKIIT